MTIRMTTEESFFFSYFGADVEGFFDLLEAISGDVKVTEIEVNGGNDDQGASCGVDCKTGVDLDGSGARGAVSIEDTKERFTVLIIIQAN